MNKIIIYENLNFFTLLLSLTHFFFYKKQYFLNYSNFVKKYCNLIVKKKFVCQIHFINLSTTSAYPEGIKMAIELSKKIVNDNQNVSIPFIKYLKDRRANDLLKKCYVQSIVNRCIQYTVIREFMQNNMDNNIYFFPTHKSFILDLITKEFKNVIIITWHLSLLNLVAFFKNLIIYMLLFLTPLLIITKIIRYNRISFFTGKIRKSNKKIIFFHQNPFIDSNKQSLYRDFYFFNSGILNIKNCIHSGQFKPLSPEKSCYLKSKGGVICDYLAERISVRFLFNQLFINYYYHFFLSFYSLAFNRYTSLSTILYFIGIIYKVVDIKNLLSRIDVKLAFFESEMGFVSSIFTILSDKYDIKTLTMAHGYGYCAPDYTRSFMIMNYFLIQGAYYKKFFLNDNPNIDNIVLIGDIEIEPLMNCQVDSTLNLPIEREKRIITIFLVFTLFLSDVNSGFHKLFGRLLDNEDYRKALTSLWRPFLEWADSQDDLFFIFKGKSGAKQYEHPFAKELLSLLSHEKYYHNDELSVKDLIAISDCTISTGNSSTLYSALCLGKPAISYNFTVPGYVPVIEYDSHLLATNPDELILNLSYILKYGISNDVFEKVRRDHYAEGVLDFKAAERIKELKRKILEN